MRMGFLASCPVGPGAPPSTRLEYPQRLCSISNTVLDQVLSRTAGSEFAVGQFLDAPQASTDPLSAHVSKLVGIRAWAPLTYLVGILVLGKVIALSVGGLAGCPFGPRHLSAPHLLSPIETGGSHV